MEKDHEGSVNLRHSFGEAYNWLRTNTGIELETSKGKTFTPESSIATKGRHKGEDVIVFKQDGTEYARSYQCCWGHYHNCNRTRIGMYCSSLDDAF